MLVLIMAGKEMINLMTWIMEDLGAYYSRFSPQPDMDSWDEALEQRFDGFSDAQKAEYEMSANKYVLSVTNSFGYSKRAVDDAEWPEVVRLKRKYKSLADLFYVQYGLMMVSSSMRDLLEEFDPGAHVFKDVNFDYETDETYYGFWTPRNLQAISIEQSDPECVEWYADANKYRCNFGEIGSAGVAFDKSKTEGRGFWRDLTLHLPCYGISDDFKAAMKKKRLSFPRVYKTKATL